MWVIVKLLQLIKKVHNVNLWPLSIIVGNCTKIVTGSDQVAYFRKDFRQHKVRSFLYYCQHTTCAWQWVAPERRHGHRPGRIYKDFSDCNIKWGHAFSTILFTSGSSGPCPREGYKPTCQSEDDGQKCLLCLDTPFSSATRCPAMCCEVIFLLVQYIWGWSVRFGKDTHGNFVTPCRYVKRWGNLGQWKG